MPSKRLDSFLKSHEINYQVLNHAIAFSALDICQITHIPPNQVAKSVIVKTPTHFFMCVIRAQDALDMALFHEILQKPVKLACEQELSKAFPDCQVGAMPPFGNLYDIEVYLCDKVAKERAVFFNAGNHSEMIQLPYKVYQALVHPKIVHLTRP